MVTPPAFVFFRRLFFIIPFFLLWPPCLKICLSPPRSLTESTLSHLTIIPALQDSLRRPSIDQQNIKQRFQIILRLLAKEYTHIICDSIMLCLLCPTWWHSWWTQYFHSQNFLSNIFSFSHLSHLVWSWKKLSKCKYKWPAPQKSAFHTFPYAVRRV